MARPRGWFRRATLGGIFAGIVGGLVLSAFMLALSAVRGMDLWATTKGAGMPFLGERATEPGFDGTAVLVGLVSHFAVSIAWAIPFAWLVFGVTRGATLVLGAAWGLVVWLGMFYVVLPAVGLGEMARAAPLAPVIVEHVLFGLSVAFGFLPFQRRLPRVTPPHPYAGRLSNFPQD